jgi:hypothetical protein
LQNTLGALGSKMEKIDINIAKINANDSIVSGKNSPRFVAPAIDGTKPPLFGLKTTNDRIKGLELDLAKINEDKKEFQNSNTKEKVETQRSVTTKESARFKRILES